MLPTSEFLIHTLLSTSVPLNREVAELAAVRIPFLGSWPNLELFGLLVELRDRTLIHDANPWVVILVEFEIERAFRPTRLDHRDRYCVTFPVFGFILPRNI